MLTVDFKDKESVAKLLIEFKGPLGYLSAMEYPLLTFFMIMTIVYGVFGLIWMVFSVMNYKELIRIQFWIGGVIFLGMLEKAVFYSEYSAVNNSGLSLTGAHKFAQAVSALKRSLARMLVIIVSLGFGKRGFRHLECRAAFNILALAHTVHHGPALCESQLDSLTTASNCSMASLVNKNYLKICQIQNCKL